MVRARTRHAVAPHKYRGTRRTRSHGSSIVCRATPIVSWPPGARIIHLDVRRTTRVHDHRRQAQARADRLARGSGSRPRPAARCGPAAWRLDGTAARAADAYRAASACAERKTPVRRIARGLIALAAEVGQEKVTVVTLHRSTLYR